MKRGVEVPHAPPRAASADGTALPAPPGPACRPVSELALCLASTPGASPIRRGDPPTALAAIPAGDAAQRRAGFGDLAPEIVDDIASRLRPVPLIALAQVDHESHLTLEARARTAKLTHSATHASRFADVQALLRQIRDLPASLRGQPMAAVARCIECIDADERVDAFAAVRESASLTSPAGRPWVELSVQIESLPREAQPAAVCDLLGVADCLSEAERGAIVAALLGRAQPIFETSLRFPVLFSEFAVLPALFRAIEGLAPGCRALPLAELASKAHWQRGGGDALECVLSALGRVPEADRSLPLLALANHFLRLPLWRRARVSLDLCRAAERLPRRDRAEPLALLISQLSAIDAPDRSTGFERLLRAVPGASPSAQALLLADLATAVPLMAADERWPRLRAVVDASAALRWPERRTPLIAAVYQSRWLSRDEQAALRAQCGAAWASEDEPGAALPGVGMKIAEALQEAVDAGCSAWLAGLVILALQDLPRIRATTNALTVVLGAMRGLPCVELTYVLPRLLEQAIRRPHPEMSEPLFELVERIPAADRYLALEKLTWGLWTLPMAARLTVFHRLLAATRELDLSRRAVMMSNLHQVLDVLRVDDRTVALLALVDATRSVPVAQRSWVLMRFVASTDRFDLADRPRALMAILDASAGTPEQRAVAALVRRCGPELPRTERSELEARCDASHE